MSERTLAELETAYREAAERLHQADRDESIARSAATAARNRVNALQKEIDSKLNAMKENASRDTDWKRSPSFPVPKEGA